MGCYYGLKLVWKGGICWQVGLLTDKSWRRLYLILRDWKEEGWRNLDCSKQIWSKDPTREGVCEEGLEEADEVLLKLTELRLEKGRYRAGGYQGQRSESWCNWSQDCKTKGIGKGASVLWNMENKNVLRAGRNNSYSFSTLRNTLCMPAVNFRGKANWMVKSLLFSLVL